MQLRLKELLVSSLFLFLSFSAFARPVISAPSVQAARAGLSARATQATQITPASGQSDLQDVPTYGKQETVKPAGYVPRYCKNYPEIIVAGGIAGAHTRQSQMQVTALETDTLSQNNSYRWDAGIGQIGAGYIFYLVDGPRYTGELRWFPSIEPILNLYYASYGITGNVYRFENVNLDDVKYKTTIKNTRLMLDAQVTIVSQCRWSLYGLLGIGQGWSRLSYRDKLGTETRIDLKTEHETNTVWEWGAGIVYAFDRRFAMSLEYVWSDLGRMRAGSTGTANTIVNPQLSGSDFQVTAQAVMLGVHVALGK